MKVNIQLKFYKKMEKIYRFSLELLPLNEKNKLIIEDEKMINNKFGYNID